MMLSIYSLVYVYCITRKVCIYQSGNTVGDQLTTSRGINRMMGKNKKITNYNQQYTEHSQEYLA